jgi:pyocin large subunit-like protein
MSEAAVLEKMQMLERSVQQLQERIERLEDLRDLQAAVEENADAPLISWDKAKRDLELE